MIKLNRHHIFLIGLTTALLFAGIHIFNFYKTSAFSTGKLVEYNNGSPIVEFNTEFGTARFRGEQNIHIENSSSIPVIYQINEPSNAAIFSFTGFFMRYFLFLIVPMVLFTAFVYSWFEKGEYVILNFRRGAEKKISKQKLLN